LLSTVAGNPMLSRLVASWLVVLILAPFTAPFPTCDLSTLLGLQPTPVPADVGPGRGVKGLQTAGSSSASLRFSRRDFRRDAPDAPLAPAVSNDAAVLSVPAFLAVGRSRLLPAFRVSGLSNEISSSSATVLRSAARVRDVRQGGALGSVLRV
jgi:hypothetical protein